MINRFEYRYLKIQGDFGFRRCKGIEGAFGVYRSRDIFSARADDILVLRSLGITTVIDLRKPAEQQASPHFELFRRHFEVRAFPFDFQNDSTRTSKTKADDVIEAYGRPGERMLNLYRGMARYEREIEGIIDLVNANQGATLIHCVNGKDRAGIVCASLQLYRGVPFDVVMKDYLLTNRYNNKMNERDLARYAETKTKEELEVLKAMFEGLNASGSASGATASRSV